MPAFSPRLVNEEYFEELDQAFATLTGSPKVPAREVAVEAASKEEINWFSRPAPQQPAPEAPVATPAPAAVSSPAVAPAAPSPEAPAFPRLGDAFAALLAAEQASPAAAAAPVWPAAAAASVPAGDLVDEVTRRVLDRMSDRAVRETVADLVSQVAERLVREEIERIKKSSS